MIQHVKDLLLGPPLPTQQILEKKLNKIRALAAFSPDALSSIAYANQEIYLGLVVAGTAGLAYAWPIAVVVTGLLFILALSYTQTIHGYPSGGGSYIVARQNLGTLPGLAAAAALMTDYLLTAAVSLTAGVAAIASAFPQLWPYRVLLALVLLVIITLINLRGLHEAGSFMSVPVYLFLFTFIPMLIYGFIRLALGTISPSSEAVVTVSQPVTLFLLLHTFSTGCTAITGIEAISNGVPAFRAPETHNAGRTLLIMAGLMAFLFMGSIGLTNILNVTSAADETILSALAHKILGTGTAYVLVQVATMLILAVAANTSFADYPRVASILAKDGFLPRQFTALGDRLVYTNGIVVLAALTGVLIVVFGGDTHALIPLFAVGVFLAFTLSQAGMVVHWWKEHSPGWKWKAAINGIGSVVTAVTLVVVGISKFREGAFIIVLVVPFLIIIFLRIKAHYAEISHELSLTGLPPSLRPQPARRVVVPISGVHRGVVEAVNFARTLSANVTAVYVEIDPDSGKEIEKKWKTWYPDLPVLIIPSPYRSVLTPLVNCLDEMDEKANDGQLATVILPEIIPAKAWQRLLHNTEAQMIKGALLFRRRRLGYTRVIIDVPFHLRR